MFQSLHASIDSEFRPQKKPLETNQNPENAKSDLLIVETVILGDFQRMSPIEFFIITYVTQHHAQICERINIQTKTSAEVRIQDLYHSHSPWGLKTLIWNKIPFICNNFTYSSFEKNRLFSIPFCIHQTCSTKMSPLNAPIPFCI